MILRRIIAVGVHTLLGRSDETSKQLLFILVVVLDIFKDSARYCVGPVKYGNCEMAIHQDVYFSISGTSPSTSASRTTSSRSTSGARIGSFCFDVVICVIIVVIVLEPEISSLVLYRIKEM